MTVTVISYPLNEINYSFEPVASSNSNELVKYLWVNVSEAISDEYIELTVNDIVTTLLITDECRYTPIDIAFQNKEGALQVMTFFKAKRTTLSIDSENFEAHRPVGSHQFVKYNISAKTKFTVNSGFLDESHNEDVRQLTLSERVWMIVEGVKTPINVTSSSVEMKTRENDRLQINYAIEFEHAFYENNVMWT